MADAAKKESWFMSSRSDPYLVGLYYFAVMLPIAFLFHRVADYALETDFYWSYAPQARDLLQNGVLTIDDFRGPVYPIVLAMAAWILGDFFRAGIVLSVISGSVLLGVQYFIVSRLWKRSTALWAVALTAVNPIFVRYSYTAGTDMLFAAMSFGAVYHVVQGHGIPGGLFAGISYLTRYNGIVLLMPALLSRKRFWILGAFLLIVLPWGLFCLKEKGSFFYNKNYLNIAYNIYAENDPWDSFWSNPETHKRFTSFASVVKENPYRFATKMLTNAYTHFAKDAAQVTGILGGIAVALGLLFLRPDRKQVLYFLFGLWMFVINLFVFYSDRFSLFLIPFYSVLAVVGCERLVEFFDAKARGSRPARVRHAH